MRQLSNEKYISCIKFDEINKLVTLFEYSFLFLVLIHIILVYINSALLVLWVCLLCGHNRCI